MCSWLPQQLLFLVGYRHLRAPGMSAMVPGRVCMEQAHLPNHPHPTQRFLLNGADAICWCRTLFSAEKCFSRSLSMLTSLDCPEQLHLGSPPTPPLLFFSSGAAAVVSTPFLSCLVASPVSPCPNLPNGGSEFTLDLFCCFILSEDHWVAT